MDACRAWIEAHTRSTALVGSGEDTLRIRERIQQLELEILERQKLEQLERLVDVDEVAAFVGSCVANAKAILEALPDSVLAGLEGVDEARRRSIFRQSERLIDTAFEELARLAEGDTDPTEDAGPAAPAGAGKTARKRKRRVASS